ncbi:uncharacterized protein (DUF1330 family) [Rubricella aquisinus]|uniref:Uncharacterized protein (DUF1330 family) n=1 Tax=Rubricella aquisinus TaxID=2028108 RepID=A0A840WZ07_9RHOB|nr:DUF1330 domain-containing protein [Rubricella aquisinus]MBB5514896.1 uncharacterized protein (DUF1330 family) [Rubricella aquisinus]
MSAPGYIIARIEVTDAEGYSKYTAQTPGIAAKFGGKFIVRAGQHNYREGDGPSRIVVIRFPSFAQAQAMYDSAEYQAVLPHALQNSTRDLVIVEGV